MANSLGWSICVDGLGMEGPVTIGASAMDAHTRNFQRVHPSRRFVTIIRLQHNSCALNFLGMLIVWTLDFLFDACQICRDYDYSARQS